MKICDSHATNQAFVVHHININQWNGPFHNQHKEMTLINDSHTKRPCSFIGWQNYHYSNSFRRLTGFLPYWHQKERNKCVFGNQILFHYCFLISTPLSVLILIRFGDPLHSQVLLLTLHLYIYIYKQTLFFCKILDDWYDNRSKRFPAYAVEIIGLTSTHIYILLYPWFPCFPIFKWFENGNRVPSETDCC